jgi:hypothetical protein
LIRFGRCAEPLEAVFLAERLPLLLDCLIVFLGASMLPILEAKVDDWWAALGMLDYFCFAISGSSPVLFFS